MATALLTRYGYPKVPGDQPESIIDVSGPTLYVPLSGAPIGALRAAQDFTGGQEITAQDFGLQSLDFVTAMGSTDGLYFVIIIPLLVEPLPNPPLPTQLPDGTFSKALLVWINLDGGGEASGNLSTSTVRLFARGR